MKKTKLKEKYKEWSHKINVEDMDADEAFTELQELNAKYGTGERWCSAATNLKCLIGTKKETLAFILYDKILIARGKMDAFTDLAIATNNFEI